MAIGEFSEHSGLSQKRLRSYATAGLLVPAAVDSASGYRYYAPAQLRPARLINALREAGMPLTDISAVLRDPTDEQLDSWAKRVEIDAAQRRQALDIARRLVAIEATSFPTTDHEHARRQPMAQMKSVGRTDIGRVRANNEDAVAASNRLAAVADGMGGPPGGEIASTVASTLLQAAFTGRSLDELEAGVRAANRAVWNRASESVELEGMGSTICAAGLVEDGRLVVVNVGDSRAYLLHQGTWTLLTHDHSVTAEAVRRGDLSEEEAQGHPHHGVLTRALGVAPDVELDTIAGPVVRGDRLLVCTDGIVNEVGENEMASLMAATDDLERTADGLIDLALSRGGRDNVSVVVAEIIS